MMNCERFHELAFDYREGRLGDEKAETIKAHMFSCSACAITFRSIENNERILRSAKTPAAPERVGARMEALLRPHPVPAQTNGFSFVAAAAAILLIIGGLIWAVPGTEPEIVIVDVKGRASEALGGLIPGYEEPNGGTRLAGTLLEPGNTR